MIPLVPIYLIGAVAAGIPLVLHLISRRHAQRVPFSTIRFLRISNERTAHRRHLQNWLLLLLRMLLFILFALALAQFIIKLTEGSNPMRPRAAVVVIMDNSYSMATLNEAETRYAVAKRAAAGILGGLQEGDEAAVLFTCQTDPPDPDEEAQEAGRFTADVSDVVHAIKDSGCSHQRGNVMHELEKAQKLLVGKNLELKEIYVLTDLQKLAWETGAAWADKVDDGEERDRRASIPIIVYDVGQPVTRNLAVRNIRVSGQAFVRDTPLTIDVDVHNPTPHTVERSLISLIISGVKKETKPIEDLGPRSTCTVSFRHDPPESGVQTIQARISDKEDVLEVDNLRSLKLEIKDKIRALIVQDAQSAVDLLDKSYFLERALDPSIALGGPSISVIRPDRLLAKDLTPSRLEDYQVVFLLGVAALSDDAAAALKEFVTEGGGLIFFAADGMDIAEYERLFGRGKERLLPLKLDKIKEVPDRRTFQRVTSVDESHFVFAPFRGLNLLKAVRVYKWAAPDRDASTEMTTLAQLTDGDPLLLEHAAGKGRVIFAAVSADAEWSNLPVTDIFLPLVHQIVYRVCGSFEEKDSLAVGATYQFPDSAVATEIDLRRPDGTQRAIRPKPTAEPKPIIYRDTFEPGRYTYTMRGGVNRESAFVVNPDTTESDLDRVPEDELRKYLKPAMVTFCRSVEEVEEAVSPLRKGIPLRELFILITIILVVFETVTSNWLTPRTRSARKPTLAPAEEGAHA